MGPGLQTNLGAFAVEHILEEGGAGYFPEPVVQPYLLTGRLHLVNGAPRYDTPIYAVYREGEQGQALRSALDGLRAVAGQKAAPRVPADRPGRTRPSGQRLPVVR